MIKYYDTISVAMTPDETAQLQLLLVPEERDWMSAQTVAVSDFGCSVNCRLAGSVAEFVVNGSEVPDASLDWSGEVLPPWKNLTISIVNSDFCCIIRSKAWAQYKWFCSDVRRNYLPVLRQTESLRL